MTYLNNDILIEDNDIYYYFKYLDWDSKFFGTNAYIVDIEKSQVGVSKKILKEISHQLNNAFVTCKLDTIISSEIINFLQTAGFKYIDTEVVLEYRNKNIKVKDNSVVIVEKFEVNENLPYEELGSSFNLTRFHADENIIDIKADLLWINYIKNFEPDEKAHMFVAKVENKVAGAILVNLKDDIAYIFFVSILSDFQSLGVGTKLMNEIVKNFDNYTIRTGTQVKNIPALNFYIKNGFSKIFQTNTVLHYWS